MTKVLLSLCDLRLKKNHMTTLLLSSRGFGYKKEAFMALAYGFAGDTSVFSQSFV